MWRYRSIGASGGRAVQQQTALLVQRLPQSPQQWHLSSTTFLCLVHPQPHQLVRQPRCTTLPTINCRSFTSTTTSTPAASIVRPTIASSTTSAAFSLDQLPTDSPSSYRLPPPPPLNGSSTNDVFDRPLFHQEPTYFALTDNHPRSRRRLERLVGDNHPTKAQTKAKAKKQRRADALKETSNDELTQPSKTKTLSVSTSQPNATISGDLNPPQEKLPQSRTKLASDSIHPLPLTSSFSSPLPSVSQLIQFFSSHYRFLGATRWSEFRRQSRVGDRPNAIHIKLKANRIPPSTITSDIQRNNSPSQSHQLNKSTTVPSKPTTITEFIGNATQSSVVSEFVDNPSLAIVDRHQQFLQHQRQEQQELIRSVSPSSASTNFASAHIAYHPQQKTSTKSSQQQLPTRHNKKQQIDSISSPASLSSVPHVSEPPQPQLESRLRTNKLISQVVYPADDMTKSQRRNYRKSLKLKQMNLDQGGVEVTATAVENTIGHQSNPTASSSPNPSATTDTTSAHVKQEASDLFSAHEPPVNKSSELSRTRTVTMNKTSTVREFIGNPTLPSASSDSEYLNQSPLSVSFTPEPSSSDIVDRHQQFLRHRQEEAVIGSPSQSSPASSNFASAHIAYHPLKKTIAESPEEQLSPVRAKKQKVDSSNLSPPPFSSVTHDSEPIISPPTLAPMTHSGPSIKTSPFLTPETIDHLLFGGEEENEAEAQIARASQTPATWGVVGAASSTSAAIDMDFDPDFLGTPKKKVTSPPSAVDANTSNLTSKKLAGVNSKLAPNAPRPTPPSFFQQLTLDTSWKDALIQSHLLHPDGPNRAPCVPPLSPEWYVTAIDIATRERAHDEKDINGVGDLFLAGVQWAQPPPKTPIIHHALLRYYFAINQPKQSIIFLLVWSARWLAQGGHDDQLVFYQTKQFKKCLVSDDHLPNQEPDAQAFMQAFQYVDQYARPQMGRELLDALRRVSDYQTLVTNSNTPHTNVAATQQDCRLTVDMYIHVMAAWNRLTKQDFSKRLPFHWKLIGYQYHDKWYPRANVDSLPQPPQKPRDCTIPEFAYLNCLQLLNEMRHYGLEPNHELYMTLLESVSLVGQVHLAEEIIKEMQAHSHTKPTPEAHAHAMVAAIFCGGEIGLRRAREYHATMLGFFDVPNLNLNPGTDPATNPAVQQVIQNFDRIQELYRVMILPKLRLKYLWQESYELVVGSEGIRDKFRSFGVETKVNPLLYDAAMRTCEVARQPSPCINLFTSLVSQGHPPTERHYSVLLRTLIRAQDWKTTLELLDRVETVDHQRIEFPLLWSNITTAFERYVEEDPNQSNLSPTSSSPIHAPIEDDSPTDTTITKLPLSSITKQPSSPTMTIQTLRQRIQERMMETIPQNGPTTPSTTSN